VMARIKNDGNVRGCRTASAARAYMRASGDCYPERVALSNRRPVSSAKR
jgi:hypothetical protein